MRKLITEIVLEIFQLAAENKLIVETAKVNVKGIEKLWKMDRTDGKRLVVII